MRLILAPMEGVVDHSMRELLTSLGGIDRCVTEFLRVSDRLLPPKVFRRICPELDRGGNTSSGVPVYLQVLGGEASVVADNAARGAQLGAPGIDLNFGCPAKTVNRNQGGSILLREPQRVHDIVAATRRAVPATTPVTAKIRLGYEDASPFAEVVAGICAAGADELVIHARTKQQGYRPPAHWQEIARARDIADIPVIANGEIWSPEDARRARATSTCQDLMLGRGALCRPDLPRLVKADLAAEPLQPMAWPEILPLLERFFALNLQHYDAKYAASPVKQWLVYLRSYYPQAAILFENIKRLRDPLEVQQVLDQSLAQVQQSAA